ncbi:MAG: hypothetical protein ACR2PL_12415 [Dehalococcoidia bacterium]
MLLLGALGSGSGIVRGDAQPAGPAAASCSGTGASGAVAPGTIDSCTVTITAPLPPNASVQVRVSDVTQDIPVLMSCAGTANTTATAGNIRGFGFFSAFANACAYVNTSATALAAGTVVGSERFTVPFDAGPGNPIQQEAAQCAPAAATSFDDFCGHQTANQLIRPGPITVSGPGATISAPGAAPATLNCTGTGPAGVAVPGDSDSCTLTLTASLPAGASLQIRLIVPNLINAGNLNSLICNGTASSSATAGQIAGFAPPGQNACAFTNSSGADLPAGSVLGTEQFGLSRGMAPGTAIVQGAAPCSSARATSFGLDYCGDGDGVLVGPGPVSVTGPGASVGSPSAPVTKSCSGNVSGGVAVAGGTDTCTVVTAIALPAHASVQLSLDSPASGPLSCTGESGAQATSGSIYGGSAANACAYLNPTEAALAAGTTIGTERFVIALGAAVGAVIAQRAALCSPGVTNLVRFCGGGAGQLIPSGMVSVSGPGAGVATPPSGPAAKSCTGSGPNGIAVVGGADVCTITLTASLPANASVQVLLVSPDLQNPVKSGSLACAGTVNTTATLGLIGGSYPLHSELLRFRQQLELDAGGRQRRGHGDPPHTSVRLNLGCSPAGGGAVCAERRHFVWLGLLRTRHESGHCPRIRLDQRDGGGGRQRDAAHSFAHAQGHTKPEPNAISRPARRCERRPHG